MSVQAISWAIEQEGLTCSEKLTLVCLANYAGKTGEAWPGQKTLSKEVGVSLRQIKRVLQNLETYGLLTRHHRQRSDGSRTSDMHQLHISNGTNEDNCKQSKVPQCHLGNGVQGDTQGKAKVSPMSPLKNEPLEEPLVICAKKAFDEFWSVYPKRLGSNPKKPAQNKFNTAIKRGVDPQTIIAGAKKYANHLKATNQSKTEFVAMASTWLNQERWNDEIEAEDEIDYADLMQKARRMKFWPENQLGTLPGTEGCKVPPHIIQPGDGIGWEFKGIYS